MKNIYTKAFNIMITISSDQKFFRKWKKEHQEIVLLVETIIDSHAMKNHSLTQETLYSLHSLANDYIMNEDRELFQYMKEKEKDSKGETKIQIQDFIDTTIKTKSILKKILTLYPEPDTTIEASFFDKFETIVAELNKNIK